jgi:hypothetical protein
VTATDLAPAALLEALHAALNADPSDAATRLMLADLLEDAGDRVAAQGQRWQAKYGRWPEHCRDTGHAEDWRWWDAKHSAMDDPDDVPHEVFQALPAAGRRPMAVYYPTRRAAEADLALALHGLALRDAVLAGYDPEPCPRCGRRRRVSSGRDHACDGCGRMWQS